MMVNAATDFTRQSFKWIKAESGTTYLCPADAVAGHGNLTEQELSKICVDESLNPQND